MMDDFQKLVENVVLICQSIDKHGGESKRAESLRLKFDWDRKVLDYAFALKSNQQLALNCEILQQTAEHLEGLASWEKKRWNIARPSWGTKLEALEALERYICTWSEQFNIRLEDSPGERSNKQLREFLTLSTDAKQTRVKDMLENSEELASQVTHRDDISYPIVRYKGEPFIVASRRIPPRSDLRSRKPRSIESDIGELAVVLNCLDPAANIGLLKVDYYLFHEGSNRFFLAQRLPCPASSTMALEEVISRGDSGGSLPTVEASPIERLKLAYKLAKALSFIHTAGFVHKNITSRSVVCLRRLLLSGETIPDLEYSYLMGFDRIRGTDGIEDMIDEKETQVSIWNFDIFQHPDRLKGQQNPRYIKTYDVYSLGVVLLEVGCWEPLSRVAKYLHLPEEDPSTWRTKLLEIISKIDPGFGDQYQILVAWCLGIEGNRVVKDSELVQKVVVPLEGIVKALSDQLC